MKKIYYIFKKSLAVKLISMGFELIDVSPNYKIKRFYKYGFEDTPELRKALNKINN